MRPVTALIVAGGTGGHLFPARFIAEAFLKSNSENRVEFVGTGRSLEPKIIDAAGFKRHVVTSSGIVGEGVRGLIKFLFRLPESIRQANLILDQVNPQIVIGVGGYVTVVPIYCAWRRGIPTMIHEAEIRPGLANKFLARLVNRITVTFNEATIRPKIKVVVTGQPLRPDMKRFVDAPLHRPEKPKNILIIGGSLGARGLDEVAIELASFFASKGLHIVHQTRSENSSKVDGGYQRGRTTAKVVSFIDDIAGAYAHADIVIARAGASTVAELALVNRPVIFVPYPYAQGDHQTANAMVLAKKGKAFVVKEGSDFSARLRAAIDQLLQPKIYRSMVDIPPSLRSVDAADKIVEVAHKLISEASDGSQNA